MENGSKPSLSAIRVMARQGVWHPEPPPPESIGKRLRLIRWDAVLIWIGIGFLLGLYLCSMIWTHFGGVFAQVAWTVSAVALYQLKRRSASLSLQSLLAVPSPVRQYPVRVELYANRRKYGSDVGVVSFVDDFLVYTGFTTDFSLSSSLLEVDFPLERKKSRPYAPTPTGILRWVTEDAEHELWLTFQLGNREVFKSPEAALLRDFHAWAAIRGSSEGNVFPPTRPKPESVLAARRVAVAWQAFACLFTVGLLTQIYVTGFARVDPSAWLAGFLVLACLWLVPINFSSISKALDGDADCGAVFYNRMSLRGVWDLAMGFFKPRQWWVPLNAVIGPKPLEKDAVEVPLSPEPSELAILV